jgi:hypothetical protein
MASISIVNLAEVQAGVKRKLEDIQKAQQTAATQMGIVARQAMQDNCVVKSGAWQKSVSSRVSRISDLVTEVAVGSNGAERYYYLQEATRHPLAIGWHQSIPKMTDIYQNIITNGLNGRSVTQNISNVDEFSMMGGM